MKVFIVGDSISIQYGPFLQALLEPKIAYARKEGEEEALRNLDVPQGANGGDSSLVCTYVEEKIKHGGFSSDLLLVNCGLHDIKTKSADAQRQIPLTDYESNLKRLLELTHAIPEQLIWISSTGFDENHHNGNDETKGGSFLRFEQDISDYNDCAQHIMQSAGIPIIDLAEFTASLPGSTTEKFCDHVHFHEHVRQQHAAFIAGWLQAYAINKH